MTVGTEGCDRGLTAWVARFMQGLSPPRIGSFTHDNHERLWRIMGMSVEILSASRTAGRRLSPSQMARGKEGGDFRGVKFPRLATHKVSQLRHLRHPNPVNRRYFRKGLWRKRIVYNIVQVVGGQVGLPYQEYFIATRPYCYQPPRLHRIISEALMTCLSIGVTPMSGHTLLYINYRSRISVQKRSLPSAEVSPENAEGYCASM